MAASPGPRAHRTDPSGGTDGRRESASGWSLVREMGVEYRSSQGVPAAALVHPAFAEKERDGAYLIVDETYLGKYLARSTECRTIRVDANGGILYDSRAAGLPDAYGCLVDDGRLAVLGRARPEIDILSGSGSRCARIDLSRLTKGMPRILAYTFRGTLLVQSYVRTGEADIVEISLDGDLLWSLPRRRRPTVGFPGSVELLANDNLLVADELNHELVEIRRDGDIAWRYGVRGEPATRPGHLANPKSARDAGRGRRIVADTRNHRVLVLEPDGERREIRPADGPFWYPTSATALPGDHVLVCDAGNRRVVELDAGGETVWEYGERIATRRWLSFPRSVEAVAGGGYAIADTGGNRVVEVVDGNVREVASAASAGLFWPRCARRLPHGGYVVADARNSRILELSGSGAVLRELRASDLPDEVPLSDPHDVRAIDGERLLVTDAASNQVLLCDWAGKVLRLAARVDDLALRDPHAAQMLPSGELLITDTGNERIVWVNARGETTADLDTLSRGGCLYRLARPRYAEVAADGTLVIADSDNNRILGGLPGGDLLWEIARVPGSPIPTLHQPRWVQAIGRDEVVVSDHLHDRIVHLVRQPGD